MQRISPSDPGAAPTGKGDGYPDPIPTQRFWGARTNMSTDSESTPQEGDNDG
jgi:hypothetical protein